MDGLSSQFTYVPDSKLLGGSSLRTQYHNFIGIVVHSQAVLSLLLLNCLTATTVSDFTTMVSSHSPAVKSKVFAGPKATKKAAQTIYDLKLKESSAAAIKTAGLIFLDKLAQLLRSKNQGSGRKTLDPLMTSHVCDRVDRRIDRMSTTATSDVLDKAPKRRRVKKKQPKKSTRRAKRNSAGESEQSSES